MGTSPSGAQPSEGQTQTPHDSPEQIPQTSAAPIVRQAPSAGQQPAKMPASPPAPADSSQQSSPATAEPVISPDQQFTKDQQFSTPAATQQLTTRQSDQTPPVANQNSEPPPPPVGTAVAPEINAKGTAGSRVAGAAIAPAKQRRIRTFAIRTALVAGAAVAIGVVVGASKASPARPN